MDDRVLAEHDVDAGIRQRHRARFDLVDLDPAREPRAFDLRPRMGNHGRLIMDPKVPDPHILKGVLPPDTPSDLVEHEKT